MAKTYGVTTTERINKENKVPNAFGGLLQVDIIDARLNIGEGLSDRKECNDEELWVAAKKLNAANEMEKMLSNLLASGEPSIEWLEAINELLCKVRAI